MNQPPVVLLTERDALIAVDLKDALEHAGYRVLGPFASAADALALLRQQVPTVAILGLPLKDQSSLVLAAALRRCGVPFLIHADAMLTEPRAQELQGVPCLAKPALPSDIVALLEEICASASGGSALDASVRWAGQAGDASNPFIRKLEGFTALTDEDRAMLAQVSAHPRVVPPHTDLVREGDAPDGVFLVMSGIACRHKLRASGARQIMAYLMPGDLCDLDVALLDTMDHTITTLSACTIVRISPETASDLLENHPRVARSLRLTRLVDEATLREWLVNVGCRSAIERIAHLFCELLLRLRAVGLAGEDSYELPITQADLGDTTGLSNVHVNRVLQDLRRQGLIELRGKRLKILNLPRLKAMAEFKANYLHLGERAAA
jgi:CRP-like cAMP-binding protein